MWGHDMTLVRTARIGLLSAAAVLAMATGSAHAQEGVAIRNLLGSVGILPPEKDTINYRERAPLVLPPKMELREPSGESFASANPSWPNDPDVVSRRRRAAEQRIPVTDSEVRRMSENNPRLTPEEQRRGGTVAAAADNAPRHRSDRDGVWLSPEEMKRGTKSAEQRTAEDLTAPSRRTLTDPPSAMRQPSRGSVTARAGDPKIDQQAFDANPINWLTRKFSSGDDD